MKKKVLITGALSLLKNQPALCSSGNQIRDFLYVEDVANAFVSLLDSDLLGCFNISSGQPLKIKDIIHKIGEITNQPQLIKLGAKSLNNQNTENDLLVGNNEQIVSQLSWQPKHDIDSGLNLTINWWKYNIK